MLAQDIPNVNDEAQFLCFCLDDTPDAQVYAINVFGIREIIYQEDNLTRIMGRENDMILGLLNIRDESVILLDMRRWLHFNHRTRTDLSPHSIQADKSLILIRKVANHSVGLKIAKVHHIIRCSWEELRSCGSQKSGEQKIVATIQDEHGSIIQVLNMEQMLSDTFPMLGYHNILISDGPEKINSNQIVLIVEDSVSTSRNLKRFVELMGLENIGFFDGVQLLEYLEHAESIEHIGAIIADIEMPKISGLEVLRRVRENPRLSHIPVIMNSSMDSSANRQSAESLGANAFIRKSDPGELAFYLKHFLQKE